MFAHNPPVVLETSNLARIRVSYTSSACCCLFPTQLLAQAVQPADSARCTGRRRGLAAALWPQLLALKHKDKQLRLGAAEPQAESSLAVQAAAAGIERWDVFISHAGEQKRSFACWLEQDLGRAGVKAFLDEHCLHLGDDADSVMEGAVRSAQIFICVLTPDFLRKRWTMQELRWALDQQQQPQQGRPLVIMPLFYGIDVDELGGHEALLQQHHPDHWRQYAADLAVIGRMTGLRKEVVDGFDNLYVKETIHRVLHKLQMVPTLVADHPVGIKARLAPVMEALQPGQPGTVVLGLWGMGGVGKTTLANAAYNHLFKDFGRHAIIEVGEEANLVAVQHQLLGKLGDKEPQAPTVSAGAVRIQRSLSLGGKVLLILDNLWARPQLDALLHTAFLPPGSRVVITTRFGGLLANDRLVHCRKHVEGLPETEALQLFCWHAFQCVEAPAGFTKVAKEALHICAGLPLALKVLGDYLHDFRDVNEWESELVYYRRTGVTARTNDGVISILRRSFGWLSDEQRRMFLDAATILHAQPADHLLAVWGSLQGSLPFAIAMLGGLQSCSMVDVDDKRNLFVHDSLRQLARTVAVEQPRALWSLAEHVPEDSFQGTSAAANRLQLSDLGGLGSLAEVLQAHPHAVIISIATCRSSGPDLSSHPAAQLRYLRMQLTCASPQCVAFMPKLCVLNLHKSEIKELPPAISGLTSLQFLDLSGCTQLAKISDDVSGLRSLQYMDMSNCLHLRRLPSGIGHLSSLQTLHLANCSSLAELPLGISALSSLRTLDLMMCNSLAGHLPGISSLQSLDLSRCPRLALPPGISALSSLQTLDLRGCGSLAKLPPGISALSSLQTLYLRGCSSLAKLPPGISALSSMRTLDLRSCRSLAKLPPGISALSSLQSLKLSYCGILAKLPSGISALSSLQFLDLSECRSLAKLPPGISALSSLQNLDLSGCGSLAELPPGISGLRSLRTLDLSGCRSLAELPPGISGLSSLQTLNLSGCSSLTELPPGISALSSLQTLNLSGCFILAELPPGISALSSLQALQLSSCSSLTELPPGISALNSLQTLDLWRCSRLAELPPGISAHGRRIGLPMHLNRG